MPKYGICMAGNEPAFERAMELARSAVSGVALDRRVIAVEIGTAEGRTTRGMAEYWRAAKQRFLVATFDIPGGWSFDEAEVWQLVQDYPEIKALIPNGGARGFLSKADCPLTQVHFAFIDGCHGAACVEADFKTLASRIAPGGVVVFHDTSEACQGRDWQPHCKTGIAVRRALENLGLLTNTCPGWALVEETHTPNGIAVFQRAKATGDRPLDWRQVSFFRKLSLGRDPLLPTIL